jgi:hypothetical protein
MILCIRLLNHLQLLVPKACYICCFIVGLFTSSSFFLSALTQQLIHLPNHNFSPISIATFSSVSFYVFSMLFLHLFPNNLQEILFQAIKIY